MKKITMFMFATCPYCNAARGWMEELYEENPAYRELTIEMIDEKLSPEIADQYDYYYVPTFFIDGEKLHEGAATKEKVKAVFDAAMAAG